ncbi:MAG: hypothetical protein ACLP1E_04360, partial [Acidimicrobiales bacterium]
GSSLLGRGEPTFLDHARLQPLSDLFPGGERAEQIEKMGVIDSRPPDLYAESLQAHGSLTE